MSVSYTRLPWRFLLVLSLLCALVAPTVMPDLAARTAFGQTSGGATLSVLATPVEVASGSGSFAAARTGQILQVGDQVRTGPGGVALLTYFDGSETQLTPETQVQLQAAPGGGGPGVTLSQVVGTTVNRVQQIAGGTSNFATNTPTAAAFVRGTRYTITVKCYTAPPAAPTNRLLTFPRRFSENQFLLLDETLYADGGQLWQTLTWQDPDTAETFDTYQYVGEVYPLVAESFYLDEDGSTWADRTWQDPTTGDIWDTYENLGFDASQQGSAGQRIARAVTQLQVTQPTTACRYVTSIVLIEGKVSIVPKAAGLAPTDLTPGDAGAASDFATATSSVTAQGLQAFEQSSRNLRDVNSALATAKLGDQVSDEFGLVVLPSLPGPGPGAPGGGPGLPPGGGGGGGGGGSGGGAGGALLGGVVLRSATADSGLANQVVPVVQVAGAQAAATTGPTANGPAAAAGPPTANSLAFAAVVSSQTPLALTNVPTDTPIPTSTPRPTPVPPPNPDAAQAVIGPGGGSVGLPDGSARVFR